MIRVLSATAHYAPMRLRLPFRYGIVTLREIEHCFVRVRALIDGVACDGIAADGLAPKWFTKNPVSTIEQDVAELKQVVASACALAMASDAAASVFAFWRRLYDTARAQLAMLPPLLRAFGPSLIERALIDAFCRVKGQTFARAVRDNTLGIALDDIHPELAGCAPGDLLPPQPLRQIVVRHTVGLLDPLRAADVTDDPADGLPVALDDCIRANGLTHFKIKLCGDGARDLERLSHAAEVIQTRCADYAFTLDGNEQYHDVAHFRAAWDEIARAPQLAAFMQRLIFVEQPLHRDAALNADTAAALRAWEARPPMIVDESDGDLDSLPTALASGYAGSSHKNCKGVFKGVANACLAAARGGRALLSGEDLCNIGPVALTQDLAVMATLGIAHVERNGHHYFKGLSMFPQDVQEQVLSWHSDLYARCANGSAALRVRNGAVDVGSVVDAPFGTHFK
jgi:hypothetical protein